MPQDLGHGRSLHDAPGVIGVITSATLRHHPDAGSLEYPPLPDDIASNPRSGFIDPRAWFARPDARLELEIGCGKGTFILEQSGAEPAINYLGIEWQYEFYAYTADRLRRARRTNVRMLHADASEFLRWRCPEAMFDVIHLYFSDPWPKAKHHKNRVIQHRFLREAWRVLKSGGELRVVTDHDELWRWDSDHFAFWTQLRPALAPTGEYDRRAHDTALAALEGLPSPAFEMMAFTPAEWVGEGCVVGTNYEKKKCVAASKAPHACVLKKRA
jgi:tRNA (guanine-N7-)-methyltransferase